MNPTSGCPDWLHDLPFFSRCSPAELGEIARIIDRVELDAGDVLAHQAATGFEIIVVVDGSASVTVDGHEVATLQPGEYHTDVAVLDGGPRTATITAETHLLVDTIHARDLRSVLLGAPQVACNVLAAVASLVSAANPRCV